MFTLTKILTILFFAYLIFPVELLGHESRPLYIKITETKQDIYSVNIKTPRSLPEFNVPKLIIPSGCNLYGVETTAITSDSYLRKSILNCEGSILGKSLELQFPVLNPSISTIVSIDHINGEKYRKLLRAGELSLIVPDKENRFQIGKEYTRLGMTHIWEGIDHLLFLLCLVFIASTPRRILVTITGFTVAHSITLVLSTLDIVRLPLPPVEAAIALSIVFVASEIVGRKKNSLTYNYPLTVSSTFGLLHGFGFASVLTSAGIPQTEISLSLLFFNIGVEIGQVIFIALVMFILFILNKTISVHIKSYFKYDKLAAYFIGSAASFWMIQRIYSFWY